MSHHNVHQLNVRGRSLYGTELDCLSAYAAMGLGYQLHEAQ